MAHISFRMALGPMRVQEARSALFVPLRHRRIVLQHLQMRMEVQRHVQCNLYIYMYHMYFGSRIKRLEKVRFPFRRYAAYGSSVIASNFAD